MFTILHESFGMRKLFSKWVPRLLTSDQKHNASTMNETWIHLYTPETKRSLAEWTAAGESRPKRPKTQQWAGKVMAFVFWDAHGILFIDYREKGKTSNSDYYMALLDRLSTEIKK